MRLLIVIPSLRGGGAERVSVNLAGAWVKNNHQVTIVTIGDTDQDFYALDNRIQRIGLNLEELSNNSLSAIFSNIKRIIAIRRIFKQHKPNIILGMMPVSAILSVIASFGLNSKVIACERNYPPLSKMNSFWTKLRVLIYPFATAVTAQTNEATLWLEENIKVKYLKTIPNPIIYPLPINKPIILPKSIIQDKQCLLLAIGRLDDRKGFNLLISAFSMLEKQFSNWTLVILGDGVKRIELEKQITKKQLTKRVLLPGRVGNLADWYKRADIYVLSSITEGFPNTLAEAMAYGRPVVSFNCKTGPSDLIRNNIDGILVNPVGDVDKLAKALKEMMLNKSLRKECSSKAIEVRDRYSLQSILEKWDNLFLNLMNNT